MPYATTQHLQLSARVELPPDAPVLLADGHPQRFQPTTAFWVARWTPTVGIDCYVTVSADRSPYVSVTYLGSEVPDWVPEPFDDWDAAVRILEEQYV